MNLKTVYNGLPPALLLPAGDYKYQEESGVISIVVPRDGSFSDIDPEFSKAAQNIGDNFRVIRKTPNDTAMIYFPDISRVLFAKKIYPALEPHQAFILIGIEVREKEIAIHGKIISILENGSEDGPEKYTTSV